MVLLSLTLLCCGATGPSAEEWEPFGLQDQSVLSLSETPWGLFAGTVSTGVHRRTTDAPWETLGVTESAVATLLFVDGPTPRLLAGVRWTGNERTDAALFASTDGGDSWTPWDDGLALENDGSFWAFSLAEDPAVAGRLYMGSSASILRSDDAGANWRFVFNNADAGGPGINSIVVKDDGASIWAGGGSALGVGRVIRSTDSGSTWEVLFPTGFGEFPVRSVLIEPMNPTRLWLGMWGTVEGAPVMWSDDGGTTWVPSLSEPVLISALVAGPDGSLYAVGGRPEPSDDGAPAGLYVYRRSHGDEWTQLETPPDAGWGASAIVTSDGHLMVGTVGTGIWRVPL
jgi:photosystem II stability/assembly factor-like uncharacterized protein